jgi:uncharacterized protein YkuJ
MTKLNDIFPSDFKTILDSLYFEENGGLVISTLQYLNDDLKVLFTLSYSDNKKLEQTWQIDIIGIEKERVVRNWTTFPEIYSDHFLLYEFIDNCTELYFNGTTSNPEKLFIDLYKSHISNYSDYLDFGLGINAPNGMLKLCTNDYGLFARGPKQILIKYAECLKANGIKTNLINVIESDKKDLKLLIFGDSYFIAKDFRFSKVK